MNVLNQDINDKSDKNHINIENQKEGIEGGK